MRMFQCGMVLALGILFLNGSLANANEVVINNSFETKDWVYWETIGNLPPSEMTVTLFDMVPGNSSWSFNLLTYTGYTGGLKQMVYVIEGVTYDVQADFAYATC